MSKNGWIGDLTCHSLQKNRWQWTTIVFTFCLLQHWACDQKEYTSISESKAQFLAKRNLRSILLCFFGDLQTILRFHRKNYTVNGQPKSHIEENSDLRTLRKQEYPKEMWEVGLVSDLRKAFTRFVHFGIILRKRW